MLKYYILILIFCSTISSFAQNEAFILQQNGVGGSNVRISQIGDNNSLRGFSGQTVVQDAAGIQHYAAVQFSQSGGTNSLTVEQLGLNQTNEIVLSQNANFNNEGVFRQLNGTHQLMLKQFSDDESNVANITQLNGSGFINIEQSAAKANIIPSAANTKMSNPMGFSGIYQKGENNYIIGAADFCCQMFTNEVFYEFDVPSQFNLPAQQISENGGNWLEIWQTGSNNLTELHQEGREDNTALIKQMNGFNRAVVYQKGNGKNSVVIEQYGGKTVYVYQKGNSDNSVVIKQY